MTEGASTGISAEGTDREECSPPRATPPATDVLCPLCQGGARREMHWRDNYDICWCQNCELLFSDPMPTDERLHEFYQGFLYREPNAHALRELVANKKRELSRLLQWDGADLRERTLLDFGGGTGVTYCAAKDQGLDVYFYEIDETAIEFVQRNFELPESRTFRTLQPLQGKLFDYIIADNVIEHDKRPVQFVKMLYEHLAPGGVAVIKTPHARNTELWFYPGVSIVGRDGYASRARRHNSISAGVATYIKRYWNCDPPRHLYSFTATSLRKTATLARTDNVEIRYYRLPLWEYSFTTRTFTRPRSLRAVIVKALTAPLLPVEWASKMLQVALRQTRLISPGGIILKIYKPR